MSQSGASQIVHQLEEYLGVKLFDRSKRPFVLTPEGEVYYHGSRKLVKRFYALEDQVRTLHDEVAGRVSVASIYSVGLSHINQNVQQFLAQHPKSNVAVEYQHPDRVYELVGADQVDLGIVSYPKSSRTIEVIPWREEEMVLACAPERSYAACRSMRLEDLDGQTIVAFVPPLRIRREIDRVLHSHGVEVKVAMEFDNTETIKRAVEINSGISLLPEPTIHREVMAGTLVAVPIESNALVRPLGIIHRRGKMLSPTARRFVQLLQTTAHKEERVNGHESESLYPAITEVASK